ncbi:MAG: 16S rRNA (uracil(1498)-N(3))-methyltransferase [Bdellovibrionales bacterium]|nr:16S rRNA (uracil(1498)-N(3))-methyltransferase [Bdellovibrionales bacterium]
MSRFFHPEIPPAGGSLRLTDAGEVRHLAGSLRLGPGQEVELADGRGSLARARIVSVSKREAVLEVLGVERLEPRREGVLCLAQAMLKGARMDWIVEKSVEGGVDALWTFTSRHSVPEEDAFLARRERWERIVFSALKQSGAPFGPRLENEASPAAVLHRAAKEHLGVVLLDPSPRHAPLWKALESRSRDTRGVLLAVGPEGGFTREEQEEFLSAGAVPARLSSAVLRGETAAISACSIARHWIDFFSPWAIKAE